jgi:hypothetical protein
MSTFTAPVISNGDAFDPADVAGGFSDFGDAINASTNVANIVAGQLNAQSFHKSALTEVWSASNSRLPASMPVRFLVTAGADTILVQTGRTFALLNSFDVEDLSLRFYVQHGGTLSITTEIDLVYAKTASHAGVVFTHAVTATLYLDGVAEATFDVQTVEASADAARLPIPIHLESVSSVSSGWHDAWVRVDFRASTEDSNAIDGFIHWRCSGRSLNVIALYR